MTSQHVSPARHPDYIRAVLNRAVTMIETGQLNSAEVLLETLGAESCVKEQVAYLRGVAAAGLGQNNLAQHFYKTALEANPLNARAHAQLGVLLLQEQPAHAAAAFAAALSIDKNKTDWQVGLAKAFHRLGFDGLARNNLRDALVQSPEHSEALTEMVALTVVEASEGAKSPRAPSWSPGDAPVVCDALLVEATRHQTLGDLDRARDLFERLLVIDPTHPIALCNFGLLERRAGHFERAVHLLSEAAGGASAFLPARLALAETYVELGDQEKAEAQLNAALAQAPNDSHVQAVAAMAFHKMGRSREALPHFHRAAMLDPQQSAAFYCALGAALMAVAMPDRAEIAYQQAVALAPDLMAARHGLAEAYQALGRDRDASAQLEAMVAADRNGLEAETAKAQAGDAVNWV